MSSILHVFSPTFYQIVIKQLISRRNQERITRKILLLRDHIDGSGQGFQQVVILMYVRHRPPLVCLTLELHFPIVVHIEKQSNASGSQLFGHTAFLIVGGTKLFHLLRNTYIFFTARRKSHPIGHYHAVMVLLTAFQRLTETVIAHKLPTTCKNVIHPHTHSAG